MQTRQENTRRFDVCGLWSIKQGNGNPIRCAKCGIGPLDIPYLQAQNYQQDTTCCEVARALEVAA